MADQILARRVAMDSGVCFSGKTTRSPSATRKVAEFPVFGSGRKSTVHSRFAQYEMAFRIQMRVPELVERGVRTVQTMHRGWDQHGNLPTHIRKQCADTDRGVGALVADLKQHGLLEDTLVVWGGEFGRTVYSQGTLTTENHGCDHHPRNFCMWMAGCGIKPGIRFVETDEFSYNVVESPVHRNEPNATNMHCMGIAPRAYLSPSKASTSASPA